MGLTVPASATAFWFMTSRMQRQPNPDRRNRARYCWVLALFLAVVAPNLVAAEARWWMDDPVRLIQTNLRETDSTLDPQQLVRQVAEFPANTLLFNLGGIVAHGLLRVDRNAGHRRGSGGTFRPRPGHDVGQKTAFDPFWRV